MFQNKSYQIDMTQGSIVENIFQFVIPLICANVVQNLFNMADMVIVGRFAGGYAMAAVGATTHLSSFMINTFMGLSVGVNVAAARYFAQNDRERLSGIVHTAIGMALVCGAVLTVLGCLLARPILIFMNTPEEHGVLEQAVLYIRIYFIGTTLILLYNFCSALFRAVGDTRRPLYFIILAGFLNLLFNLLFVCGWKLGVAGVALGTILSQAVSCVGIMRCLVREKGALHLGIRKICFKKNDIVEIARQGIPASLQQMMYSYANIAMQSAVNSFGADVVAGNVAVASIEGLLYSAMLAFQNTMVTFAGQNYAVGNKKRIRDSMLICTGIVFAIGTVVGNSVVLGGKAIMKLFTDAPEIIEAGGVRMVYILSFYGFAGASETVAGTVRGMGCSIPPAIASFLWVLLFRILWIDTVFAYFKTLPSLYLLMVCSWIAYMISNIFIFFIFIKRIIKRKIEWNDK